MKPIRIKSTKLIRQKLRARKPFKSTVDSKAAAHYDIFVKSDFTGVFVKTKKKRKKCEKPMSKFLLF